jgi:hypothetical protein
MLAQMLGSRLRSKVIGWFFTHADERSYVRQLGKLIGEEDSSNLSRELSRLARLGILTCHPEGRQKYYQANPACPIFQELKGIAVKTFGLGDALRSALAPLGARLRLALIFGSFAAGNESAASDIDLLLVGNTSLCEVSGSLGPVGRALGREINPVVYNPEELKKKAKAGNNFVATVLAGAKIFLIGGADDLAEIAG